MPRSASGFRRGCSIRGSDWIHRRWFSRKTGDWQRTLFDACVTGPRGLRGVMMTGRSRKLSPPLAHRAFLFCRAANPLLSLWICPKSVAFVCPRSLPSLPSVKRSPSLLLHASCPSYSIPLRPPRPPSSSSTSPPAMSADLYPQSTYAQRTSYPARSDQSYPPLSNPSTLVYPPTLIQPSSQSIPEGQSTDSPSQSPARDSQSPKTENATVPKQDGAPQQQPAKPQATFLTKLYAYVFRRVLLSPALPRSPPPKPPRTAREPPHDPVGSSRRAYHRRAARTTRSPCPPQRLPSVAFRKLLSATQRKS